MASSATHEAERPIFQRLLPGPQRLPREAVRRHQHVRLCGALVAALDRYGYDATTVTTLARLAGVSRRAFYDQFANKDECLLSTFDEVAGELRLRLRDSLVGSDTDATERLSQIVALAASSLARDPRWLLLFAETNRCSREGATRICQLIDSAACVLGSASAQGGATVPPLLLRGAVAGVYNAIVAAHAHLGADGILDATPALTDWVGALASPRLHELVNVPLPERVPAERAARATDQTAGAGAIRERVLRAALRAAALRQADGGATPATIADEAGVAPELVLELYSCMKECLAAARTLVEEEVLNAVEEAAGSGGGTAALTRDAIATLLAVVADHVAAVGRPCADAEELLFRRQLILRVLAIAGVPALGPVQADATASAAAFPAVRSSCHRRIAAEQLALLALAPHLGADRAISQLLVARLSLGTPSRSVAAAPVVA